MRTACCKAGSFCFGDFADVSRMLMAMKFAADGAENLRVQSICVICEEREFNFLTQISQIKRLPHSGIPSLLMAQKTQMIYTSHARGGAEVRVENLRNLWRYYLPQMAQRIYAYNQSA